MISKDFEFENGQKVREKITGFEGIITGTCFYLTGCNQYLVTAKVADMSKEPVAMWYDEGRLELMTDEVVVKSEEVIGKDNGPDRVPTQGRRGA